MTSTTTRPTKRQRQRVAAEARAAARHKQRQRRTIARALEIVAAVAVAVVAVAIVTRGPGTGPAAAEAVDIAAKPRTNLIAAGEAVPEFSAPALDGGDAIAWTDHLGTPTVLAIWAPWCPACQAELPVLDRVVRDTPGVQMVTITTAIGQHPDPTPDAYLAEHGLTFPVAIDDEGGTLASAFGLSSFPSVLFVDSSGTVVRSDVGVIPEASVRETVRSLT